MSTSYRLDIPFQEVKNRVESLGLFIDYSAPSSDEDSFCITDGDSYLWCYNNSTTSELTRYGANNVSNILELLSDAFNTEIISEHDEGFFEDEGDNDE